MKRSVEFDLFTKIEPNARFASRAGMFAKSKRVADQRAAVKAVLTSVFGALVPPSYVTITSRLCRNRIAVKLTRIAPGRTADAWENLRGALKAVKDEVARWCGFDDKEGSGITWLDPGQESQGQHVYRVRIEITDDAPGKDRIVVLAETASEGRAAKSRVKREVKKAAKMHNDGAIKRTGRVLTYAAERVLSTPVPLSAPQRRSENRNRDPGEERPARDIVDGRHCCGVAIGEPCKRGGDHEVFVNGVHYQRAKAAGVLVGETVKIELTPWLKKAPTNGTRRLVPPAQAPDAFRDPFDIHVEESRPPAYVRLPYERTKTCPVCEGADLLTPPCAGFEACEGCNGWGTVGPIRREERCDGERAPEHVSFWVPVEHRARFGDRVTLTRRRATLPKLGDVWLYE